MTLQALDLARPAAVELPELVRLFKNELRRLDKADKTIDSYEGALRGFVAYMSHRGITMTDQLTRARLIEWQNSLKGADGQRVLMPRSRALYCTAARCLLRFAAEFELIDLRLTLAIAPAKVRKGLPRPIPPDDLRRIAAYFERKKTRQTLIGLRSRALFWLLVSTGARISEALQLTRTEVERLSGKEAARAYVIQKGGAEKLMLCPKSVVAMIRDYLEARQDRAPWLFVSHASNYSPDAPPRLDPGAAGEAWHTLAQRARVRPFTSHMCRHTSATELLAAEVPETAIAEHMGHADLRQLMNYAQVDMAHRSRAVDVMEQLVRHHRPPKLAPKSTPAATAAAPNAPLTIPLSPLTGPDDWSTVAGAL